VAEQAFGRFRVARTLGRGTYGVVFEAIDPSSGRRVAVKVLASSTDEDRARLVREAQVLSRLRHPNVVSVLETGTQEGVPYLVMELVEGGTLAHLIARTEPRDRLLALLEQAARGLHAAHEAGCVHRDVKPDNILVDASGARVADFGLVRVDDASRLTATGTAMGTPAYMAPEMIQGDGRRVGAWTDVFSLGVILFQVLAGRLPIETRSLLDLAHELGSPAELPLPSELAQGVPPDLDDLARRALTKDPATRIQSARELADGIRSHLDGEPLPRPSAPPRKRRGLLAAALAAVAVAGAALVATRGAERSPVAMPAKPPPPPPPLAAKRPAREFPDECQGFLHSKLKMIELSLVLGEYRLSHTEGVSSVAVSPDGLLGASGSTLGDDSVRVFDLETGKDQKSLLTGGGDVRALVFARDRLLALTDQELLVWTVGAWGEPVRASLAGPVIVAGAISADGGTALVARAGGAFEVWSLLDAEPTLVKKASWIREKPGETTAVALTPDGARALVGTKDGSLALLDVKSGSFQSPPRANDMFHNEVAAIAVTRSGKKGLVGYHEGGVEVMDMELGGFEGLLGISGSNPSIQAKAPRALAVSPRGDAAFLGASDGTTTVYDLESRDETGVVLGGHHDSILAIAVTPDGKRVVTGGRDRAVRIWDVGTGKEAVQPSQHRDCVRSVAYLSERRAASVSSDGQLRIWDLEAGKLERPVSLGTGAEAMAVFGSGKQALVGGHDGSIQVRDLETGEMKVKLHVPRGKDRIVYALELSKDESQFLSGGEEGAVTLWSVDSREPIRSFRLPGNDGVTSVHFVTEKRVLSSSMSGELELWDLEGHGRGVVSEHTDRVIDTTVDGTRALSGSWDRSAVLWDLVRGRPLARLDGRVRLGSAAFLPGERAITLGSDHLLRIWDLKATLAASGSGVEVDAVDLGSSCDVAVTRPALSPDRRSFLVGTARGVILEFRLIP
jgi:WD40 repeat protein